MSNDCGCSCGCSNASSTEREPDQLACPRCEKEGKEVPFDVIKTFIQKDKVKNDKFYICLNPDCAIAYYNESRDCLFSMNDIQKPIWFKKGSEPKIACYCNNITYDQVKTAVKEYNLSTWKEIVTHYKQKAICECSKLNPTGECCSDNFHDVINQALKESGKQTINRESSTCC